MQAELHMLLQLINGVAVIAVIAYLLTRSRVFRRLLERRPNIGDRLLLILAFGAFSVYGTLIGSQVMGGTANIRDLGPAIAGLVGGPLAGLGAGIIGGIYRYLQGGFTALACALAPLMAGLAGGVVFLVRRGRFPNLPAAVLLMVALELVHMALVLALSRPFSQALELVEDVIFPMVAANAAGMAIHGGIMANLLRERSLEQARDMLEGELRVARGIQMGLVPKTFPPAPVRDEFSLYAILEPAREVGGDLYDFYFADRDRFFIMVGDVSGKGIPAALFMAVARTIVKAKMSPEKTLAGIIGEVNRELCEGNDAGMFVTAFCGFLDLRTGGLTFVNAGHNPPVLIRADGSVSLVQARPQPPLGIVDDPGHRESVLHIEPGATLLVYTDGITEAENAAGEMFGTDRLLDLTMKSHGPTVGDVVARIRDSVRDFAAGTGQADDMTLLALRFNGPVSPGGPCADG